MAANKVDGYSSATSHSGLYKQEGTYGHGLHEHGWSFDNR